MIDSRLTNVLQVAAYLIFVLLTTALASVTLKTFPPLLFILIATAFFYFFFQSLSPVVKITVSYLRSHTTVAILLVGVLALLLNGILGSFIHQPIPGVRDEFAYLLGADTFANGHLTNPTHPFWKHFASAHIIHEPSYQSKYPPAQSLVMALGQALTNNPAMGVWLSMGLGTSALLWMLLGWVPARWAILGTFLFLLNYEVFRQWGQTYWGGAVALTGGCLVFGALPRLRKLPTIRLTVMLSLGIIILAFSRPLEGGLATLCVMCLLTLLFLKSSSSDRKSQLKNILAPLLIAGVVGGGLMGYYNKTVTGSAFRLPYQVWLEQQGAILSHNLIGAVKKNDVMPDYQGEVAQSQPETASFFDKQRGPRKPAAKMARNFNFYVGITMFIPMLLLPLALKLNRMKFAGFTCLVVLIGVFANGAAGFPHYIAPVAGLIVLLLVQCLRLMSIYTRKHRLGKKLLPVVPIFALCTFLVSLVLEWFPNPVSDHLLWSLDRENVRQTLLNTPGKHLVLVSYSIAHPYYQEWVYNEAKINRSKIIWAKSLSDEENSQLTEYFKDRTHWEITPTLESELRPYKSQNELAVFGN